MAELDPIVEQVKKQQIEHLFELVGYLEHLTKRFRQIQYRNGVLVQEWSDKDTQRMGWLFEEQTRVNREIREMCSRLELVDEPDTTVMWGNRPVRTRHKSDQSTPPDARG